ncbi:tetratricopeptide repeat protein [Flavobacterium sp. 2]|uniref:tetratricopeptide repeat protein n=1 Tax=Flavobacterium sp. 2 TaxID=308053 RepID=UPI003CE6913C
MNVTDYTYLINKPDTVTEKQAETLGSVLNEFPYFQSARALRLKGLYKQNSFKYNYALKVTAAHTTDRSVLFDFITSEEFTPIQGEYYNRKLRDLLNITVFDVEIISAEEKKKLAEIRIDPIEKSILDSIKEATTVTFEESEKTEEKPIEPVFEEEIIQSEFQEPTVELSVKEETPIIKEPSRTFLEDRLEDEIPNIHIDPIEKSVFNAIKEAENVIFEEVKTPEESVSIEIPETIITTEETITSENPDTIEIPETILIPEETITIAEPEKIEIPETVIEAEETKILPDPIKIEISEAVKTAEENLEIGKPLDFSGNEKHSFQEWLQLARTEPIDRTIDAPMEENLTENAIEKAEQTLGTVATEEKIEDEKKKKAEIIDRFIEANPKISPIKQTAITAAAQLDINKDESSYLMTETLARVYLEQKKYTKAIQAYEILILKYPEKITFFADRISDIKILQQNNNNNN